MTHPLHLPEVLRDWGLPARDGVRSRWRTVDGGRWHSREAGAEHAATPWVLVHGLVISSLYWVPLLRELGRRAPAYAPDLPGFGRTHKPRGAPGAREQAAALAGWHAAAGLGPCHVVGNSLGCSVAAEWAAACPEQVRSLALIGPTNDSAARAVPPMVWRLLRDMPHAPPALFLNEVADLWRCGIPRGWATAQKMIAYRWEPVLPRLRCPTLWLHGEHDPIAPQRWLDELHGKSPGSRLLTLPGAGHVVHYSHPEEVARELGRWAAGWNDETRVVKPEGLKKSE